MQVNLNLTNKGYYEFYLHHLHNMFSMQVNLNTTNKGYYEFYLHTCIFSSSLLCDEEVVFRRREHNSPRNLF